MVCVDKGAMQATLNRRPMLMVGVAMMAVASVGMLTLPIVIGAVLTTPIAFFRVRVGDFKLPAAMWLMRIGKQDALMNSWK